MKFVNFFQNLILMNLEMVHWNQFQTNLNIKLRQNHQMKIKHNQKQKMFQEIQHSNNQFKYQQITQSDHKNVQVIIIEMNYKIMNS